MKALAYRTDESGAFLYMCALLARPRIYDKTPNKALVQEILNYAEQAMSFIRDNKLLTKSQYNKLLKLNTKNFWDLEYNLIVDDETDSLSWSVYYNKNVRNHPDFTKQESTLLNYWHTFMRNDESDSGIKAMERFKTLVGKVLPKVSSYYTGVKSSAKDQQAILEQIKPIVKDLIGKSDTIISIDKAKQAKAKDPIAYTKYLALRRLFNDVTNDHITDYLRTNGRTKIVDLISYLDDLGLSHSLPSFDGLIDEQGYYTKYGELLNGKPVGEILMNPKYTKGSSQYVLKYKAPGAKGYQSVYTANVQSDAQKQKFAKVGEALPLIEKARAKWQKDIMGTSKKEVAILTELLFLTKARIGTKGNETDGKPTYGLTTLLAKHLRIKGNEIHLRYVGKKGQKQHHIIKAEDTYTKEILSYLDLLKEELSADEPLFETKARDVNTYLKSLGLTITPHKFRTLHGTLLMQEQLDKARAKLKKKPTAKEVVDAFTKSALAVGKLLGHFNGAGTKITGATAIKSYIDPSIMVDFFDSYNVQLPSVLSKLIS